MHTTINVRCRQCGKNLNGQIDLFTTGNLTLSMDSCPNCTGGPLKDAIKKAEHNRDWLDRRIEEGKADLERMRRTEADQT